MAPMLLAITLLAFTLIRAVPGGPLTAFALNPGVKPEDVARMERTLGLDRPGHEQYVTWLLGLMRGDLGRSLTDGRSVADAVRQRVPNTLVLTGAALVLEVLIAVPVGVLAALRHRRTLDSAVNVLAAAAVAVPTFWLAILAIIVFSVQFHAWGLPALPSAGMVTLPGGGGVLDRLVHLVLPVGVLALPGAAALARYTRSAMIEQLGLDYVRTARAKGLPERGTAVHALRNALLPVATVTSQRLPVLLSGALLVEVIFAWPGMGQLAYAAATQRDYTMLMALVVVTSALVLLGSLVTDVLCAALDPRIRLGQTAA